MTIDGMSERSATKKITEPAIRKNPRTKKARGILFACIKSGKVDKNGELFSLGSLTDQVKQTARKKAIGYGGLWSSVFGHQSLVVSQMTVV